MSFRNAAYAALLLTAMPLAAATRNGVARTEYGDRVCYEQVRNHGHGKMFSRACSDGLALKVYVPKKGEIYPVTAYPGDFRALEEIFKRENTESYFIRGPKAAAKGIASVFH